MINEDEDDEGNPVKPDHQHKAVNAKTYCAQAKKKWRELHGKAQLLDAEYDKKIEELGSICSTMFKQAKNQGVAEQSIEQQMGENQQKVDVLKKFVREVNIYLEKVTALESENRADLMVMFNQKLVEYNEKSKQLEKVLSEMTIRRVIEDSFGGDFEQRKVEESILSGEDNQKSVNTYLIQKIHTLEDRVNAKFESEQSDLAALKNFQTSETQKVIEALKDKDLKAEKQHRELKAQIAEVRDQISQWSNHTMFQRVLFELQVFKRAELDQRFIEKLLRTKVSDQCIFSLARIPDSARLVVDANKRATILSEATFEVTAELDPNDSQMVAVGFQKDKMIAHFASMFNISYQTSGKYYQLANTDTNNWQHCLCIPDDNHVIQGAHGGLVYVYSTQQISYFV